MSTLEIFGLVALLFALGGILTEISPICRARRDATVRRLDGLYR